jgi:tetratricopeptide (TPR) repeat protein
MEKRSFDFKMNLRLIFISVLFLTVYCNQVDPDIEKGATNLELGDFKQARAHFQKVLENKPSSFDARLGLAKALLQQYSAQPTDSGLIFDCLTQLEAARTLRPDKEVEKLLSVVWFKRATMLLTNHDTIAAMGALSRSTGFDPHASNPLNLAGILYFNRGDHAKALNLFGLVISTDSASVQGYFNAGMVHWADSNYSRAYEYWYKAALSAPDDKEIITWASMAKRKLAVPANNGTIATITDEKIVPVQKTLKYDH